MNDENKAQIVVTYTTNFDTGETADMRAQAVHEPDGAKVEAVVNPDNTVTVRRVENTAK